MIAMNQQLELDTPVTFLEKPIGLKTSEQKTPKAGEGSMEVPFPPKPIQTPQGSPSPGAVCTLGSLRPEQGGGRSE